MQHMNNVEFLRFFETARIEYIIELLARAPTRPTRRSFGFIFAECHIAYRAPAFFGDEIRTYVWPAELKRSSLQLEFEMRVEARRPAGRRGLRHARRLRLRGRASRSRCPDGLRERLEPELGPVG